jgi:signal-transduction protein with cAMP-binding, CBS, and nucleotidyltransferase domain
VAKVSAKDFREKKLYEVMQKAPTINQETEIDVGYMQVRNSPSEMVAVTDNQDKLVGVITKSRVLEGMLTMSKNKTDKVEEIMYKDPVRMEIGKTVNDALTLMNQKSIDKLPVVDAEGKIAGVVTRRDLLEKFRQSVQIKL